MTELLAYRACLIEINKVLAPAMLLDDFNYLFRKAIQHYFNKKYNLFEVNLQLTDDLRVLVKTKALTPTTRSTKPDDLMGTSYKCELPTDYVHILNCICEFEFVGTPKCPDDCKLIRLGADKLDSSLWSTVITNYYMRPSMEKPYYYISNIDEPVFINSSTTVNPKGETRYEGYRYGNATVPVLEIKCGRLDPNKYKLKSVYIDYLRAPLYINLTLSDIDNPRDRTLVLEFPDYVLYEIINEMVALTLENGKDPRLQTHIPINTTIPGALGSK